MRYVERKYVGLRVGVILYEADFGPDRGRAFAHAPLQGFGDMLIRRIRNRIQSLEGEQICSCWCNDLPVSVSACVSVSICASAVERSINVRLYGLATDPRAQPLYSDFISSRGLRIAILRRRCDSLPNLFQICFLWFTATILY